MLAAIQVCKEPQNVTYLARTGGHMGNAGYMVLGERTSCLVGSHFPKVNSIRIGDSVMDGLIKLFADTLNVSPESLNEDSSPDTVTKWDSMAAANLVAAIEEAFAVKLSTRDIMGMRSIAKAREVLRKKGVLA
jgi:acyl carrier protein